jgi:hypothetical protein
MDTDAAKWPLWPRPIHLKASLVGAVVVSLSACTFPQHITVIRQADVLRVDGVEMPARIVQPFNTEAIFMVKASRLVVQATGRALKSSTVRLGYVVPVTEHPSDVETPDKPLAVAVELTAPQDQAANVVVDGSVSDEQGLVHRPDTIAWVEGYCGAYPRPYYIHPLPSPRFNVEAGKVGCLYLGYTLKPRMSEVLKLKLGSLTIGTAEAPQQLELTLRPALTRQFNG